MPIPPLGDDDDDEEEIILYRAVTPEDNNEYETEGIIKSWAMRGGLDPQAHLDRVGFETMLYRHQFDSNEISSSFISSTPYITQTHKYRLPPTRRVFVFKVPESRIIENYMNAEPESLLFGPVRNHEILGYIQDSKFTENPGADMDFYDYVKIENDIKKLDSCGN